MFPVLPPIWLALEIFFIVSSTLLWMALILGWVFKLHYLQENPWSSVWQ